MKLSLIIATHNGGDRLGRVLAAYTRILDPRCIWSVLVVDNGSTDQTPRLLDRYAGLLPLAVLREPAPGKNRALNHALEHLPPDTDACIFSDDDALPAPSFLSDWCRIIRDKPGVDLFGGTILPQFPSPPPPWLLRHRRRFPILFAERRRCDGTIAASQIYGPNMAVRTRIFAAGYRYHERFGPNRSDEHYPMGSETEFCQRVEACTGARSFFASAPAVEHIVRPEQFTRRWVAARAYRHGYGLGLRSDAAMATVDERVRTVLHGIAAMAGREASWWQYHWQRGYIAAFSGEHARPAPAWRPGAGPADRPDARSETAMTGTSPNGLRP